MLVFLNGQFLPETQAVVPVNDRGFLYGDGLFETLRVVHGRPFRLAPHLERLMRGADFLRIKCPFTPGELEKFAGQLIEKNKMPDAVLRLTLTRGPGDRGYTPKATVRPTLAMTLHAPPPLNTGQGIGWNLVTSSFRIPAADPLSSFKTTSKLIHVLARMEAIEKGADEALLVNTDGDTAETAGGNLFWVDQDTICTVPAGCGALPGITRALVLEISRTLGFETSQRVIQPGKLRHAEGLFITQSVLGIVPVTVFNEKPVPPSPLVKKISCCYNEIMNQFNRD